MTASAPLSPLPSPYRAGEVLPADDPNRTAPAPTAAHIPLVEPSQPHTRVHANRLIRLEYTRVPHFFYQFYVWKYATSFCAALAFHKVGRLFLPFPLLHLVVLQLPHAQHALAAPSWCVLSRYAGSRGRSGLLGVASMFSLNDVKSKRWRHSSGTDGLSRVAGGEGREKRKRGGSDFQPFSRDLPFCAHHVGTFCTAHHERRPGGPAPLSRLPPYGLLEGLPPAPPLLPRGQPRCGLGRMYWKPPITFPARLAVQDPADLLEDAGVDVRDPKVLADGLAEFSSLVKELSSLLEPAPASSAAPAAATH